MKSSDDSLWLFETFPHLSAYRGQNSVLFWRLFDAQDFYQNLLLTVGTSKTDFDILILAYDLRVLSTSEFILSPCLRLLTCGNSASSAILILSEYVSEIQGVGRLNYATL